MKAVVTGAGGFLGRHIVSMLRAAGHDVVAVGRRHYPFLERLGVTCRQVDVRDADALAECVSGCEVVFHTAAIAGIWGKWSEYYSVNTQGTQAVVDACRRAGVGKLVFTSSPSVTFDGRPQEGIDESAAYPRRWLAHYPHSKALAEQIVLAAHGTSGLATCALRPHLIWGPGDPHLIPRLLDRARRRRLVRVGSGTNRVDITFVENAAAAHLAAAERLSVDAPLGGRAYFISQGEPVNCWRWIDEVLAMAGLPPVRRRVSYRVAYWVGAMLEIVHRITGRQSEPRMTRFLAAQLALPHYFDISAARRDVGYQPLVSTDEGMRRLCDAMPK